MVLIIVFLYPNAGCNDGNKTEVRIFLSGKEIEVQVQCNFTSHRDHHKDYWRRGAWGGHLCSVQFSSV